MCGPDGRTSINGVPVWWCDGPYCREHSEPVHTCAEAVTRRGYVLALSPDKTHQLQQAVADMPLIGVDKNVITATRQMFTTNDDVPIADDETRLAAWGLQYEMIDETLAESDGDVIDEPTTPEQSEPEQSEPTPLVGGEVSEQATFEQAPAEQSTPAVAEPLVDEGEPTETTEPTDAPLVEEGETHATNDSTD